MNTRDTNLWDTIYGDGDKNSKIEALTNLFDAGEITIDVYSIYWLSWIRPSKFEWSKIKGSSLRAPIS